MMIAIAAAYTVSPEMTDDDVTQLMDNFADLDAMCSDLLDWSIGASLNRGRLSWSNSPSVLPVGELNTWLTAARSDSMPSGFPPEFKQEPRSGSTPGCAGFAGEDGAAVVRG